MYSEIAKRLYSADKIVILTGAGVSAESGIQTFRDPDGLWTKMNPAELASIDGFLSNPDLVWQWYKARREMMSSKKPNPGHYAIAELQKLIPNVLLFTQNIDRLHQQAGSEVVYELHGNIVENHCMDCKKPYEDDKGCESDSPPKCQFCGGKVRPSVVWFGEMLPYEVLKKAQESAISCDVFFSIGTSAEVYPAADLPLIALRNGAYVVEVNPHRTVISDLVHARLGEASGLAMPKVIEEYKRYVKEIEN
jgi:NAD-dependent deacetylase